MNDDIDERNIRLNGCYIPNLKPIIQYLNAVRKQKGKLHSDINVAEKDLPLSAREMFNSNYAKVIAGKSKSAFEEAIVIHEVLMFEGIHAIPSYHPELDHIAQHPRSEECSVSEELPINTSPSIDGIQLLQMIEKDDIKTVYQLIEEIGQKQSGTPTFDDDVTYITKQLNTPEYDISYFVALLLKHGRQNDFSSRRYKKHLLTHEGILKNHSHPLATPKESSSNKPVSPFPLADIIPLSQGTPCEICYYDTATTFKTTCCSNLVCLDCFSKNIEMQDKISLEHGINQHQMIECIGCESPIKLGEHEQALSETAKSILSHFHQRYIANFHVTHSDGIPVFCNDDQCKKAYLLNHNTIYFQCDNIEYHTNQRVRLHHSLCQNIWTPEHECPQTKERREEDYIETIKYLIKNIDTIKPCADRQKKNCKVLIEKIGGCPYIKCSKCSSSFYWCCETDWYNHSVLISQNQHEFVEQQLKKKRFRKLNNILANLQKTTDVSLEKKNEDRVHEDEEELSNLTKPISVTSSKKALSKRKAPLHTTSYPFPNWWSTLQWF